MTLLQINWIINSNLSMQVNSNKIDEETSPSYDLLHNNTCFNIIVNAIASPLICLLF